MRAAELTDDTRRALRRRGGEHGGGKDGRRGVTAGWPNVKLIVVVSGNYVPNLDQNLPKYGN